MSRGERNALVVAYAIMLGGLGYFIWDQGAARGIARFCLVVTVGALTTLLFRAVEKWGDR